MDNDIVRLPCFHTFHRSCFNSVNNVCPHCSKLLLQKVCQLAQSFNEALLSSTNTASARSSVAADENSNDENNDDVPSVSNRSPEYYESSEWHGYISTVLDTFDVPQPSMNTHPNQDEHNQDNHAENVQTSHENSSAEEPQQSPTSTCTSPSIAPTLATVTLSYGNF